MDAKDAIKPADASECESAKDECDEAYKECEGAIKVCEEAALSSRYLLTVCVVIIILLGSLLVYLNLPYGQRRSEALSVYYMMPLGCKECDVEMVRMVSSDVGEKIDIVVSDSVSRPSLLLVSNNRSTLWVAGSRLNILSGLCSFANNRKSCDLRNNSLLESAGCLRAYNISGDSLIFYTQGECDFCRNMSSMLSAVRKAGNFSVVTLDVDYKSKREIASKCLSEILDVGGKVPQLACPSNGLSRMGLFSSEDEMRKFAQACRSA
jgi:hypothetical protein